MAPPTSTLLFTFTILFTTISSSSSKNFTFDLIHRDSPHSPLYNPLTTVSDRLTAAFRRSISRSRHFNHQIHSFTSQTGQTDLQTGQTGQTGLQTGLQTGQIDLQTGQTDIQTGQIDLQTVQTDLQTGQTDLQTGQIDLQTGQTDLQTGQTDLQSGLIGVGGEFFMSITIGTPPIKVLAIADTGSDLTWFQCKPCEQCYKEKGPIFDKNKSSTYKTEPCNSRNCHALSTNERGCDESNNICKYRYSYGDQSFTKGDVASETISINSPSGSSVSFPETIFGCGYNNGGTFEETGSGIIGLGGGELSLISQLSSSISKKFSYCLSHTSSTSVINLGTNSISTKDSSVLTTPLVNKEPKTYYYLTLEAITVGKTKIPYTGPSYTPNKDGILSSKKATGNIIIDSGTTLTLLDSSFYGRFGDLVEESVTRAKRVSDPQGLLSHCFEGERGEIGLPEIRMHFTDAEVRLSAMNAFVKVSEDMVCLSMIPTNDVAIYGNFAQMNFLVGYDLEKRTVSFQSMNCSGNL